jgi:3-oxoacyl-[acyl-carrier protein] reductase
MDLGYEGRTIWITGASGGIGRALARVFGDEGAQLVLHGFSRCDELSEWVAEQPWSHRAQVVQADTRDPVQVRAALDLGRARFGRVDVCIANAGLWPRANERLDQASVGRIENTLAVNLLGSVWTARAWMAGLAEDGPVDGVGGSLVFIGSTAGRFGESHHADYAMAKAGLVGLMLSLKNEVVHLDPFARVNVLEPGWTVTEMAREALEVPGNVAGVCRTQPLRQLARAVDIATLAAFLASDRARHVNGQVVTCAGGMEGRSLWQDADVDEAAVRERAR